MINFFILNTEEVFFPKSCQFIPRRNEKIIINKRKFKVIEVEFNYDEKMWLENITVILEDEK
jgi:hypothetical protein